MIFYSNLKVGIINDPTDWMAWSTFIIGFIFVGLTALFIYIYWKLKSSGDLLREKNSQKSLGSFKGFWANYRGSIIIFLSVVFLIIGLTFIISGFFGTEINSGLSRI